MNLLFFASFQNDAKTAVKELLSKVVAFQANTWGLLAEEPETSLEGQRNRLHDLMMDMKQMERILKELVIFETDLLEQWERFKKTIGLVDEFGSGDIGSVGKSQGKSTFGNIPPLVTCIQEEFDLEKIPLKGRLTSEQIETLGCYLKKKYRKVGDVFEQMLTIGGTVADFKGAIRKLLHKRDAQNLRVYLADHYNL